MYNDNFCILVVLYVSIPVLVLVYVSKTIAKITSRTSNYVSNANNIFFKQLETASILAILADD